jgi:signal transduction histidine kinase
MASWPSPGVVPAVAALQRERDRRPGVAPGGIRASSGGVVWRNTTPRCPRWRGSDRLLQVFLNLIRNGRRPWRAAAETHRPQPLRALARRRSAAPPPWWRSGTGAGHSHRDTEQLFDPFFTTKDGETGWLPISLRIVEEHGGAIEVQSQMGQGSTFCVLLPITPDDQGA